MIRTYEYRLYPRHTERQHLDLLLEQGREAYNAALNECRNAWETQRNSVKALDQWPYFREWRKQPGIELNASSLQHLLRRIDKAYAAFFRRLKKGETPGHPRFKSAQRFNSLEYTYADGCKFTPGNGRTAVFYVQNVGNLKVKFHRPLPPNARIKHVVLKRKVGRWYVYLMLDMPDIEFVPNGLPQVGIDMGLHHLLALSNGTVIDNPRWFRNAQAHLRCAQRRLARRKKGGQRRAKARLLVARLHEHVANQRKDFYNRLAFALARTYGLMALEDLDLGFMLRNHHLALSAHDAGLGFFQKRLACEAAEAGAHIVLVNPAYTSQMCSGCGVLVKKALHIRVHVCSDCHLELDRDVNAARNILRLAFESAGSPPSGDNAGQ